MRDETYFKQVNRRLAAAQLLLSSVDDSKFTATPVGRQALLESSLLQFYFAVFSYLNELLAYYHRPEIDCFSLNLAPLLSEPSDLFNGIYEFTALRKWSQDNGDILLKLSQLPQDFVRLSSKEKDEDPVSQKSSLNEVLPVSQANLIAVSIDEEKLDLNDGQVIKDVLSKFQLLIESQRENQSEY